jgi:uncharacterized protein YjbI with pentapeptide repeats
MEANNSLGSAAPRWRGAWSWLGPHLPGAVLELVVFALVALPATWYLEQRIADRQEVQADLLASAAEVQENLRFARELSTQHGGVKPMNGIDLHGASLSGLLLGCQTRKEPIDAGYPCQQESPASDAAHMIGSNLAGANLTATDLTGAILAHADLSGATLVRAGLAGADLSEANLVDANLSPSAGINLEVLGFTDVGGATLDGATLVSANLAGADLTYAGLAGAALTNAKLPDANLTHARLSRADLRGADLTGVIMDEAALDSICFDDRTRWPQGFPRPSNPDGCER